MRKMSLSGNEGLTDVESVAGVARRVYKYSAPPVRTSTAIAPPYFHDESPPGTDSVPESTCGGTFLCC